MWKLEGDLAMGRAERERREKEIARIKIEYAYAPILCNECIHYVS